MTLHLPPLAFLDVETTGLSPYADDRICEIAVLRVEAGKEPVSWQTLINPCKPISAAISKINQITDAMVADAPRFPDIADVLRGQIDGTTLVCHNAPFDLSFLTAEFARCNYPFIPAGIIDTLQIARRYFGFDSNKLGSIAEAIQVDMPQKHRAMADVHATHAVFKYLVAELVRRDILQDVALLFEASRSYARSA